MCCKWSYFDLSMSQLTAMSLLCLSVRSSVRPSVRLSIRSFLLFFFVLNCFCSFRYSRCTRTGYGKSSSSQIWIHLYPVRPQMRPLSTLEIWIARKQIASLKSEKESFVLTMTKRQTWLVSYFVSPLMKTWLSLTSVRRYFRVLI